jgi:hypothetical protein
VDDDPLVGKVAARGAAGDAANRFGMRELDLSAAARDIHSARLRKDVRYEDASDA